jgi:hypothetical protein
LLSVFVNGAENWLFTHARKYGIILVLGTKFGSRPCDRSVAAERSYIPGMSSKAAKVSGFLCE